MCLDIWARCLARLWSQLGGALGVEVLTVRLANPVDQVGHSSRDEIDHR